MLVRTPLSDAEPTFTRAVRLMAIALEASHRRRRQKRGPESEFNRVGGPHGCVNCYKTGKPQYVCLLSAF
jgi:hypothetical protein